MSKYLEKSPSVHADEAISDVKFNYETLNNTTVTATPWKTLDVNGMIRSAQTAGQQVTCPDDYLE